MTIPFQFDDRCARPGKTRAGFTLLELIIVMALLVTVAALSLPHVGNLLISQKLEKGADRVRTGMGRARVLAIRTGKIHAFFVEPGTTRYTVAPFEEAFSESAFNRHNEIDGLDDRGTDMNLDEERLPRNVTFAATDTPEDARAYQATADTGLQLSSMRPILFYPDGTSQNATVILQNERGHKVKVVLRGLTGSSHRQFYSD